MKMSGDRGCRGHWAPSFGYPRWQPVQRERALPQISNTTQRRGSWKQRQESLENELACRGRMSDGGVPRVITIINLEITTIAIQQWEIQTSIRYS